MNEWFTQWAWIYVRIKNVQGASDLSRLKSPNKKKKQRANHLKRNNFLFELCQRWQFIVMVWHRLRRIDLRQWFCWDCRVILPLWWHGRRCCWWIDNDFKLMDGKLIILKTVFFSIWCFSGKLLNVNCLRWINIGFCNRWGVNTLDVGLINDIQAHRLALSIDLSTTSRHHGKLSD